MVWIQCDVTECAFNDNGECVAGVIQVEYDGCLTFEEEEEEKTQ